MSQVISTINSGVRLQSYGNSSTAGELQISGDTSAFFPIIKTDGSLASGGAMLTINPGPPSAGTSAVLLSGQALTLSLEYNQANTQVRFNVVTNAGTVPSITSGWVALGQEHSVGVAYDAQGKIILAVDGVSDTTYTANFSLPTASFVSNAVAASTSGNGISNFNGYVDQIVTFNSAPSVAVLNQMTADPAGVNNLLKDHTEYVVINYGKTAVVNGTNTSNAPATTTHANANTSGTDATIYITDVSGIQVGDQILKNSGIVGYVTYIDGTQSATGGQIGYLAPANGTTVAAADVISFVHQKATVSQNVSSISPAVSSTTLLPAPTGVFGGDFQIGDTVTGLNIPLGSQITAISTSNAQTNSDPTLYVNSLTLSSATTSGVPNGTIAIAHNVTAPSQIVNAITPSGTKIIQVAAVGGIQVGDLVTGVDIPSGTYVTKIDGTVIPANGTTTLPTVTVNQTIPTGHTENITFTHPSYSSVAFEMFASANASVLTLATSSGAQVGDSVYNGLNLVGTVLNIPSTSTVKLDPNSYTAANLPAASGILSFVHNSSILNSTGFIAAGSKTLTVTNNSGVQVGDTVTAASGITSDVVVSVSGNTVTLATASTASVGSASVPASLVFTHPVSSNTVNTVGYQNSSYNGITLPVYDTHGIQIGDLVIGTGIPVGDYVKAIDSEKNQVTLNTATTAYVAGNTPLTFTHQTADNVQFATISSTTLPATAAGVSYKVGDNIVITVPTSATTTVTKTYTVVTTDVSTTNALKTESNIASSIVKAFPTIGGYQLQVVKPTSTTDSNTVGFVPMQGTPTGLPLIQVSAVNSVGVVEDQVSGFYNLSTSNTTLTATTPIPLIDGNTLNGVSTTITVKDTTGSASGVPKVNAVSYSTASSGNVAATKVAHGPVYVEFANYVAGGNATYNVYVDPGFVNSVGIGGTLNSVGLTLQVPTADVAASTSVTLTPMSGGTLSLVNSDSATSPSLQWASNQGLTDFSQPIASFTLQPSANATSINATVTNLSVNNKFFQDAVSTSPMLVGTPLNAQVYTITGHVFNEYNQSGFTATTTGTPWAASGNGIQRAIPNTDLSYTVAGNGSSDIRLSLEKAVPAIPTAQSPSANVNLDVVASSLSATASKVPFSMVIDLPSNSSGTTFVPGVGVTATATVAGHLMTITGLYTAPKGNTSTTPTLGVINATLANEFNSGSQFTMDSLTISGAPVTGQSLFVGFSQTDANGAYSLTNVPAGSLTVNPINNNGAAQNQSAGVNVSDALAALNIAAGKGIPSTIQNGLASTPILATNLLPSDYIAADYDGNGVVTASDALQILQYYVAVNKPAVLSYKYLPATANSGLNTTESLTSVVLPAIPVLPTDKDPVTQSILATGNNTKIVDIVGVLPGDIAV